MNVVRDVGGRTGWFDRFWAPWRKASMSSQSSLMSMGNCTCQINLRRQHNLGRTSTSMLLSEIAGGRAEVFRQLMCIEPVKKLLTQGNGHLSIQVIA